MSGAARIGRRPIRRLDPATVERIAAGEVVERPASVVKELVENAIDAGATAITVRIVNGGLDRIEVADDGVGIPPSELELAVERHATSKLAPEGPVEDVGSLGFRGEALAAIATVARLRLYSRTGEQESSEGISIVGGALAGRFVEARAPGTTVEVEDLFFNTPARRKFLKSPAAEQVEIVDQVERVYAAHPSVTVRLESEGRELGTYPATSDLREAAARVLGPEFLRASFSVGDEVPGGRLHGALGRPPFAASTPRGLYLAVNGRAVASRALQGSVRAAFAQELPRGRYPVGLLHLELDRDRLDVNVHPTKREVRLAREREVAEAVRVRVREALIAADPLTDVAPRPGIGHLGTLGAPSVGAVGGPVRSAPSSRSSTAGEAVQKTLDRPSVPPAAVGARAGGGRPSLTLLGCVQSLYWVAESGEGLVLIDQHAASERVLFDALYRGQPVARQALVDPVTIRLSGTQRAALRAHADEVLRAGFDVEEFGPGTHRVRTVPTFRGARARAETVGDLLDELADGGRPTVPDGMKERTAATLACHAAIRAGDTVGPEEFSRVLGELAALGEAAVTCPHGRPILLRFDRSRLDRWFLRSGT